MAYDEGLAERVRAELAGESGLSEKKMFGGIAFFLDGNMAVGVSGDQLMVRVGPARHEAALQRPHARVFDMSGRPMKGWIAVGAAGLGDDEALSTWVGEGAAFARTLPPK